MNRHAFSPLNHHHWCRQIRQKWPQPLIYLLEVMILAPRSICQSEAARIGNRGKLSAASVVWRMRQKQKKRNEARSEEKHPLKFEIRWFGLRSPSLVSLLTARSRDVLISDLVRATSASVAHIGVSLVEAQIGILSSARRFFCRRARAPFFIYNS